MELKSQVVKHSVF